MWPLSAAAQTALRGSHAVTYRATAYTAYGVIELPFSGGSVTADGKSMVRRTASLSVSDPSLWEVMAPFGTEVSIEYGIGTQDGIEWVPMIMGPANKVSDSRPRATDVGFALEVSDRSLLVGEARFEQPVQTVENATYVAEIARLLAGAQPDAPFVDLTGDVRIAPVLDIDRERWSDGIEKLADAIAAECYCDRLGGFVLRPTPVLDQVESWLVDEGETGILISANRELTRAEVFNAIILTGQRSDGTPPILAKVYDLDPDSPTRWGGPFGKKPRFATSPLVEDSPQAVESATALLERAKGVHASIGLTSITNPALEPGDVLVSRIDGRDQRHLIDSVTTPLTPDTAQTFQTRSKDLPQEG